MTYDDWTKAVDAEFKRRDPVLYQNVIDAALADGIDTSSPIPMVYIRGDEPQDVHNDGMSADNYVSYLIQEYKTYGPGGE